MSRSLLPESSSIRNRPSIQTDRLQLRPFALADALVAQRLAGDRDIASTTLSIPHPYEDGVAEHWISTHQEAYERGDLGNFVIVLWSDDSLIGAIGLHVKQEHRRAELGFWIGKAYWRQGYCTESARAVVEYGFDVLDLNRIYAHHFSRNPASGRVMQKIGMRHKGSLRQHIIKWDSFEHIEQYGILKADRVRQ